MMCHRYDFYSAGVSKIDDTEWELVKQVPSIATMEPRPAFRCCHDISHSCIQLLKKFSSDRGIAIKIPSMRPIHFVRCQRMEMN